KLDYRAKKYVFVGYADGVKEYRLYDRVTRKIVISRDVKFDEGSLFCKNDQEE
ncbi:hypothetical protein PJP10_32845, partial [Mycobacterium kansasii]